VRTVLFLVFLGVIAIACNRKVWREAG